MKKRPRFSWWHLTGLAGIVYALGSSALALLPARDVFRTQFLVMDLDAFFAGRQDSLLWVAYLEGLLAGVFLLIFSSGLRSYLSRAEGGYSMWSHLVLVAGGVAAALTLTVHPLLKTLALVGTSRIDDSFLVAAIRFDSAFQSTVLIPLATLVLAVSVVDLRTGVFSKSIGGVGLFTSTLLLVGAAWPLAGPSLSILGFSMILGRLLLVLWILAIGIKLLRVKKPPLHMPGEGLFDSAPMIEGWTDTSL